MTTRVLVAVAGSSGERLADGLERAGIVVVSVIDPSVLEESALPAAFSVLDDADVLVLPAQRRTLGSLLVSVCDRRGIRIVPLSGDPDGERVAHAFGLAGTLVPARADAIAATVGSAGHLRAVPPDAPASDTGRIVVVWGPEGSPGRSTLASLLAFELARGGTSAALIDADSYAPSLAMSLGLPDEGPGFPAACRQAGLGALDQSELRRISSPVRTDDVTVDVLCGINRRGRWPELAAERVTSTLEAARAWTAYTVVDVAAPLEQDEEVMHDLEGPRRNAATLAALRTADVIVAVCAADPVGIARFVRGYSEVRAVAGATPVLVIANRVRPGGLGLDARGQIRRTLDRFTGIRDVSFLPWDQRSTDAAVLAAQPLAAVAPRSALVGAVRRFVGETLLPVLGQQVRPDVRPRRPRARTRLRRRERRENRLTP
ncbi:MAG TPA: hypothetical protein DCR63_03910 [Microbacterium sp.]|nr:hypothetical protein [Microbacterium sp.]